MLPGLFCVVLVVYSASHVVLVGIRRLSGSCWSLTAVFRGGWGLPGGRYAAVVLVGVFDVVEHAGVSAPADVGEGVPEGEGVGFVALDEGREAAGALGVQRAFRFLDQPAREA